MCPWMHFVEAAMPSGGFHLPVDEAAMPFEGVQLPLKLGAERLTGRLRFCTLMGGTTCVSGCC